MPKRRHQAGLIGLQNIACCCVDLYRRDHFGGESGSIKSSAFGPDSVKKTHGHPDEGTIEASKHGDSTDEVDPLHRLDDASDGHCPNVTLAPFGPDNGGQTGQRRDGTPRTNLDFDCSDLAGTDRQRCRDGNHLSGVESRIGGRDTPNFIPIAAGDDQLDTDVGVSGLTGVL